MFISPRSNERSKDIWNLTYDSSLFCYSDVRSHIRWKQQRHILQHSFARDMRPELPEEQGPNGGHPEGFLGLTSAILTQVYTVMHTTDQASLTLMIAVGPSLVAIAMMCYQASWRLPTGASI